LELPLVGFGAPQPDFVLLKVGGNEGDDLPHVQTFSCPAKLNHFNLWDYKYVKYLHTRIFLALGSKKE
jgi:hypothetical protein